MSPPRHPSRIILGILSALIVTISVTGAAATTLFHATVHTIDTNGALSTPTQPLTASHSPETVAPTPTGTPTVQPVTVPQGVAEGAPLNFLIIGSDTREDQGKGFGSAKQITGQRSDTTILIHLNSTRTHAVALSIPRDLWTAIPTCTNSQGTRIPSHEGRFNEAYSIGGAECTIRTIKEITGIPIHHVIIVDFQGFQRMVDTLGGITICTTQPIHDTKSGLNLTKGTHLLNGAEALALARTRYSLGDGSDISRITRQQHIIRLFLTQIKQTDTLTNPIALYSLTQTALDSLTVDTELANPETFTSLLVTAANIPTENIQYLTWPWLPRPDGATIQTNKAEANQITKMIKTDTLPLPASLLPTPSPHPTSGKKNKKPLCTDPVN